MFDRPPGHQAKPGLSLDAERGGRGRKNCLSWIQRDYRV